VEPSKPGTSTTVSRPWPPLFPTLRVAAVAAVAAAVAAPGPSSDAPP
jgi:hypothetical protein